MGLIDHKQLRRLREAAERDRKPMRFYEELEAGMSSGQLKPDDFSFKQLFEEFVEDGHELVQSWDPKRQGGFRVLEFTGAVDTSAFANISGQIVYTAMLEKYAAPEFTFSNLVKVQPTGFNGEKIAGISQLGDVGEIVAEGKEYPTAGVSEDWIETPVTTKRGTIVEITKEALFFDRTGQLLDRCRAVGESIGLNKEKRIIDCVIDENSTAHRYKWKGTSYGTYQASAPWINVKASNALVDWTSVDGAEQIFTNLIDPFTGEPIMIVPKHLIVTRDLLYTARRVVSASEIRTATPGYATSANPSETSWANPISNYQVVTSQLLKSRLATDSTWFIGDIQKAFRYMENWPLAVVQAPANAEAEFRRDVVQAFKASERGTMATFEPRAMVKCTA